MEVVTFDIFRALSTAMQLVILLVTLLFFVNTLEMPLFTVTFGLLKRYAGGTHANWKWICLAVFTVGAHAVWLLCRVLSAYEASYLPVGEASEEACSEVDADCILRSVFDGDRDDQEDLLGILYQLKVSQKLMDMDV